MNILAPRPPRAGYSRAAYDAVLAMGGVDVREASVQDYLSAPGSKHLPARYPYKAKCVEDGLQNLHYRGFLIRRKAGDNVICYTINNYPAFKKIYRKRAARDRASYKKRMGGTKPQATRKRSKMRDTPAPATHTNGAIGEIDKAMATLRTEVRTASVKLAKLEKVRTRLVDIGL